MKIGVLMTVLMNISGQLPLVTMFKGMLRFTDGKDIPCNLR